MQILKLHKLDDEFFGRRFEDLDVDVSPIIEQVKAQGDLALRELSRKFDGIDIDEIRLSQNQINEAFKLVEKKELEAIEFAIENVKTFAQRQFACLKGLNTKILNSTLGHKIIPLQRAGCYVPGGNYPLPSSAVMTVVPAKVANVEEIIVCSPKIKPLTIAAAKLAGADIICNVGGAQAIAAMAFGTQSIPKADKIVGPGNKYVTKAKKMVYGVCGIDFLAGPSEILIIADNNSKIELIAADILAQCEHDKDARAYLVCDDEDHIKKIIKKCEEFLTTLPTAEIARSSFSKSFAILVNDLNEAVELSDKLAPEHLELCFEDAEARMNDFKNYGSLFVGEASAESFADYCTGTNHTLPTNQISKYSGGLSVFDFVKIQTYQIIAPQDIEEFSKNSSILAQSEGLFAHKLSSDLRRR